MSGAVIIYLLSGVAFTFVAKSGEDKNLWQHDPFLAFIAIPFWLPIALYLIFSRGVESLVVKNKTIYKHKEDGS